MPTSAVSASPRTAPQIGVVNYFLSSLLMFVAATQPQGAGAAFTSHTLATATEAIAEDIQAKLTKRGGDLSAKKVEVTPFAPIYKDAEKSAGSGICGRLLDQLKAKGVNVVTDGLYALTGGFSVQKFQFGDETVCFARLDYELKRGDEIICRSEPQVYQRGGRAFELPPGVYIGDLNDIQELVGSTVEPALDSIPKYEDDLAKPLDDKNRKAADQVFIDGTLVRAKTGGRFAVEVLVADINALPTDGSKPDDSVFQPCMPYLRQGVPYVRIEDGQAYAVRIHNSERFPGPYRTAATLSIDGLSSYYFSNSKDPQTGKDKYDGYRIFDEVTTITGWYRDNEHNDAFVAKRLANASAADQLIQRASKGSINVRFRACWKPGIPPIDFDDKLNSAKGGWITTKGQSLAQRLTDVSMELGTVIGSITIRYDRPEETN